MILRLEIRSVNWGHSVSREEILVAEEIQPSPPPPPSHSPHYESGSRVISCFTCGLRSKRKLAAAFSCKDWDTLRVGACIE